MATNRFNNKLIRFKYRSGTFFRILIVILLICTPKISLLQAQNPDIILQDLIIGKTEITATNSITLRPGFHAKEGSNFSARIGSSSQTPNSSIEIPAPPTANNPVSGTAGMNFVKSITYREAQTSIPTGSFKHLEDIQYVDGLGRPVQTVQVGTSPTGNDIIQPVLYDQYGREAIIPLPYTDTKSGDFRTAVTESTVNTYYSSNTPLGKEPDGRAFTQIVYDNSPLNRVVSQTGPGTAWENKPVVIHYLTNTETKPGWDVTGNNSYSSFSYAANTLFVNETIDEQGNYTREYKDKLGQVILKETKLGSEWLRTAYIYDDFGLLRCVVPPEATGPSETELCYYYLYDEKKRMIEKKIPGGGTTKMVYDNRDRLRATQNSIQAFANEWTIIKYDDLNRPVLTGTKVYPDDIKAAIDNGSMNESRNNVAAYYGYTNNSFPTSGVTFLSATYYDDYGFRTGMNLNDSLNYTTFNSGSYNITSIVDPDPKGQVTGTMTKVLSASADNGAVLQATLFSANYYDKLGHLLRSISENHLKGKDVVSNIYEDITYQVLQTKQEHHKGTEHITIEKWIEYDHTGRVLATREKINDQPEVTINAMKYNEVGELIAKYLHSNQTTSTRSFIQKEDYQYNIRGWMNKINDPTLASDNDVFGMQLFYNSTSGLGSLDPGQGLYNGNIAGIKWGTKNEAIRGYQFSYDNLNRLLQSNYAEGVSLNTNTGYFTESITGYDKNGNIQGLQRKFNNTLVDNLDYDYLNSGRSNQLLKITDAGTANSSSEDYPGTSQNYIYDANGNMTSDGAKNITLSYNPTINLPKQLDFGSNNRLFYHYTAGGAKLIKHSKTSENVEKFTHYIGNIVYEGSTLSYIITDEGRLVAEGTGANRKFLYEYNLKDHLGNTHVTFMGTDLGGAVDIVQTTSYYPFGLVMSQMNGNTLPAYSKNKYLYNGKEIQDDSFGGSSLNWYDYGARFYDPQIGRWHVVDSKVDDPNQISQSPYQYAWNNPVYLTDPDGNCPICIVAAIVVGKALLGAAVDGGTQYVVNRSQGMNHSDAMNNLDYTSMGASAAISSVSAPGVSTTLKTAVTATAITLDATIDVSNTQTQTALGIGGAQDKPLSNVALDATFGTLDIKTSNSIINGSKSTVANDLLPSNYAPLDAASKQMVKTTEKVVNSGAFEQTVNAASSVTLGNSGIISSSLQSNNSGASGSQTTNFVKPITMPVDNTKVVIQTYPIR